MTKKDILIVHFRSPMDYPPVFNLARYLARQNVTVRLVAGRRKESSAVLRDYGILLTEVAMNFSAGIRSYLAYFTFYSKAFFQLIKTWSTPVVYFESISAPPVFLYFLLFPFSKRKLAIHYHEYFDKEEHRRQSFLERFGRMLEPMLFKRALWISHTNGDRLRRFHQEFTTIDDGKLRLMPNFPPRSWLKRTSIERTGVDSKIKLVCVGALSMEGLFLRELAEWMVSKKGQITCDIYSKDIDEEMLQFFKEQPYEVLTYKGSLRYDDIQEVLGQYHVGLILYKGIGSSNVVYSASNKLFEYMACGLDVWFSKPLLSTYEYETTDTFPKVVKVDFSNLEEFDYQLALNRKGLVYKESTFVMESVYDNFHEALLK